MSAAVPLILRQDLSSAKNLVVYAAADESAAYAYGAGFVLRTTVEDRNGRIGVQATLTSLTTQQNTQVLRVEGSSSDGLLPLTNALAKQLNPAALEYSTRNPHALQSFTTAAQTPNSRSRIALLQSAVAADPSFGLAYIALAETLVQTGQDAAPILKQGAAHRNSFTPLDRARFDALAKRIERAPLPQQEQAAAAVLRLAPNQIDALAALGSARFLAGDAETGERLLNRALDLEPGSAALRQQLALGLFESRRFAEAEKVLQAMDNNPSVLPALAACILLEGDSHRADVVFQRYLETRPAGDSVRSLLEASWLAVSGRSSNAIALLEKANLSNPEVHSIALSQTAIWQLMAGDRNAAEKNAAAGARLDPRTTGFAAVAVLLVRGNMPAAQWRDLVNTSGLNAQAQETVLGYGFFLNGHYAEAAQIWQAMLQRSGGADLRARAMLAASLSRSGQTTAAQKFGVEPFVPEFGELYAAVSFDQMRRLLGLTR